MKDEPDEANKRALLLKARKKLCVLSNAGHVANHHPLAAVRRNSQIILAAQAKMEAWRCKSININHDMNSLRFQRDPNQIRRVSNVGKLSLADIKVRRRRGAGGRGERNRGGGRFLCGAFLLCVLCTHFFCFRFLYEAEPDELRGKAKHQR
jgi:hypothetical protein